MNHNNYLNEMKVAETYESFIIKSDISTINVLPIGNVIRD